MKISEYLPAICMICFGHLDRRNGDKIRDAWLNSQGWVVFRIPTKDLNRLFRDCPSGGIRKFA